VNQWLKTIFATYYRTLMTLIKRILADKDVKISVNPPHPLYQRSMYYLSKAKIR